MAKYNKKILKRITDLIRKDSYSIVEICTNVGISESCFYKWQSKSTEFTDAIKAAREEFDKLTLVECEKSLVKLIKGFDFDEKKTVMTSDKDGKPTIKEQTLIKKHVAPSLGAIIHFQTNKDPENWKNKQSTELTGKDGKDLFSKLTDEELDKKNAELNALIKKLELRIRR